MSAQKYNFAGVRVLAADSLPASMKVLKSALKELGFREIATAKDVDDIRSGIEQRSYDLVIADTHLPPGDVCQLVHTLRHGALGCDPFIPIVLTTWEPTEDVVQGVVGAGVDVLLTLPMSQGSLLAGLERLVTGRKPFVVTSDYVGPDRRKRVRAEEMNTPLIEVPNPVRAKATGHPEPRDFRQCVNSINEQKVERHAYQIRFLIKALTDDCQSGVTVNEAGVVTYLARLREVADDMGRRIADTRHAHQAKLCQSLIAALDDFDHSNRKALDRGLQLLTQMALAIDVAVHSGDRAVDPALDIARAVREATLATGA